MRKNKIDVSKVIIRKPTDDEQRNANIVTSDYLISALTIHSSILTSLGFVDKIYRSKETNVICSNIKKIAQLRSAIEKINKKIGNLSLKNINTTAKSAAAKRWVSISNEEMFDGLSEYKYSNMLFKDFVPIINEYFNKIETPSIKRHSQTVVWEKAFAYQSLIEKELGKKFTPKDYAINKLSNGQLQNIQIEWGINLLEWEKGWSELCDYLYSPNVIKKIRENIGVKVRPRKLGDLRKGTESTDKNKFKKIIEKQALILGNDFNLNVEKSKLIKMQKKVELLQSEYDEAKLVVKHATINGSENLPTLKKACTKMRQKLSHQKKKYNDFKTSLEKKKDAMEIIREYEIKEKMLDDFINSTRKSEEISEMENAEIVKSIQRQKAEKKIPYYTWRFVCDKINNKIAQRIEEALETNLNKGCGVNGEDGYINVTAFPMDKSFEFFVDYPKSSNMFRAFKKKGKELSKILLEGVATHLGIEFVNCEGETFYNNPMEKTMGGDMLEWIGL